MTWSPDRAHSAVCTASNRGVCTVIQQCCVHGIQHPCVHLKYPVEVSRDKCPHKYLGAFPGQTGPTMTTDEKTYTLAEAEALLRTRQCRQEGHGFADVVQNLGGDVVCFVCPRCGTTWYPARNGPAAAP